MQKVSGRVIEIFVHLHTSLFRMWYVLPKRASICARFYGFICIQDAFARATHSAYADGRPSAARDDMLSCIQWFHKVTFAKLFFDYHIDLLS